MVMVGPVGRGRDLCNLLAGRQAGRCGYSAGPGRLSSVLSPFFGGEGE